MSSLIAPDIATLNARLARGRDWLERHTLDVRVRAASEEPSQCQGCVELFCEDKAHVQASLPQWVALSEKGRVMLALYEGIRLAHGAALGLHRWEEAPVGTETEQLSGWGLWLDWGEAMERLAALEQRAKEA